MIDSKDNYLKELRVLFVDDEDGVRGSYEKLLNMWVSKVYTASNGKEGLEIYENHPLDLIITDIKMPIMSGLEMTAHIKRKNPDFPVVITTAHQEPELLLDAIEYHVDAYIIKPIVKKELKKHLKNIGKILHLEKEILRVQKLNQFYLDTTSVLIIVYDIHGTIIMANREFTRLLGYSNSELVDHNIFELNIIPDEDIENMHNIFLEISKKKNRLLRRKVQQNIISKDRKKFMIAWSNVMMIDKKKNITILSSGIDITALNNVRRELKKQAYTDALTQISNRAAYNEKITELLSLYYQNDTIFSFLIYDIDDFKTVNDTYGHKMGDLVLIELSALTKSLIRQNDYHFRIGGEEFVVLFKETPVEKAQFIAEKIRKGIEERLNTIDDRTITISIGLTQVDRGDDSDSIFKRADKLLYDAKRQGKNMVCSG
ncbi:MAG: hypothetical protein DRG30_07400 [Epsilonproteobacteria bacterium]|nr:MAG: hypothetical protein DRG30_07400 [Campylobacterota bacterium]